MKDIIDASEQKPRTGMRYSILSLLTALLAMIIFFVTMATASANLRQDNEEYLPLDSLFSYGVYFSILGIAFTLFSFRRKEPFGFVKWAGTILNALLFVFWAQGWLFGVLLKAFR